MSNAYAVFLAGATLISAISAGFILAQSPKLRATQLGAALLLAGAWWALCGALWNASADADSARRWMHLSTPGWAFIAALLPHSLYRYLDTYTGSEMDGVRRRLKWSAVWGYGVGAIVLLMAGLGQGVFGEPIRVDWGWDFAPGPAMIAYFFATGPPVAVSWDSIRRAFRASVAVSPPAHRAAILVAFLIPLVLVVTTETTLPLMGVLFPRLGSTAYALFGLLVLVTGIRYGLSFFTVQRFSDEILDTLLEGVVLVTAGHTIRRANRGFAELSGRSPESLVGEPLQSVLEWEGALQGPTIENGRGSLRGPGNTTIPVEVSSAALYDEAGNSIGIVAVVRDLREIEALRMQMLTQARLAAVGELAAGLAHEINNPLAFVRSNLGQIEKYWKSLEDAAAFPPEERDAVLEEGWEILEESRVGVDRAAEIVRGVQRFTHGGSPVREPSDLNELVKDALTMLRPQSQSTPLEIDFQPGDLPVIDCSAQEMRQVLLNLLVNAIQASGPGSRVSVTTGRVGEEVVVMVADDGCGIAPEDRERIFDPFFTTKPAGEGTGLGLGIAWQIVDAHGGRIHVDSTPGEGSRFRVFLPRGAGLGLGAAGVGKPEDRQARARP